MPPSSGQSKLPPETYYTPSQTISFYTLAGETRNQNYDTIIEDAFTSKPPKKKRVHASNLLPYKIYPNAKPTEVLIDGRLNRSFGFRMSNKQTYDELTSRLFSKTTFYIPQQHLSHRGQIKELAIVLRSKTLTLERRNDKYGDESLAGLVKERLVPEVLKLTNCEAIVDPRIMDESLREWMSGVCALEKLWLWVQNSLRVSLRIIGGHGNGFR
ncbi:MAG: hypothetical protein M1836_007139 [Candelina mexicana]|nr:MAG: hypothetical protein M1836_007139 [Candelina mexicana]